ncbi:hypothetical protein LXJ59_27660, partial [Escherichia coli]|nr:hypothetical protein [Escherichia coli]
YGALGVGPDGRLTIGWHLEDDALVLEWNESRRAGTQITPGKGFGTLLVDTSARQLGASVTREIADDHYRLSLSLPRDVTVDG